MRISRAYSLLYSFAQNMSARTPLPSQIDIVQMCVYLLLFCFRSVYSYVHMVYRSLKSFATSTSPQLWLNFDIVHVFRAEHYTCSLCAFLLNSPTVFYFVFVLFNHVSSYYYARFFLILFMFEQVSFYLVSEKKKFSF